MLHAHDNTLITSSNTTEKNIRQKKACMSLCVSGQVQRAE